MSDWEYWKETNIRIYGGFVNEFHITWTRPWKKTWKDVLILWEWHIDFNLYIIKFGGSKFDIGHP